jgi:hypothetical protein
LFVPAKSVNLGIEEQCEMKSDRIFLFIVAVAMAFSFLVAATSTHAQASPTVTLWSYDQSLGHLVPIRYQVAGGQWWFSSWGANYFHFEKVDETGKTLAVGESLFFPAELGGGVAIEGDSLHGTINTEWLSAIPLPPVIMDRAKNLSIDRTADLLFTSDSSFIKVDGKYYQLLKNWMQVTNISKGIVSVQILDGLGHVWTVNPAHIDQDPELTLTITFPDNWRTNWPVYTAPNMDPPTVDATPTQ